MGTWQIYPGTRVAGTIRVPGDKSVSHRALILGALSHGKTHIQGLLNAGDVHSTAGVLSALGVSMDGSFGEGLTVYGRGPEAFTQPEGPLDCGNSGTTMRLMSGVLAACPGIDSTLVGDESLHRRPMNRVVVPLSQMGAQMEAEGEEGYPPLVISGRELVGISYASPVASAQIKSAILLAGLSAQGTTEVIEPGPSRDHTERMLKARGAQLTVDGSRIRLEGRQHLEALDVLVPSDLSSAAFFLALGALRSEEGLRVEDVGVNPTRTGVITALKQMGVVLEEEDRRDAGGEPVASLLARKSDLVGVEMDHSLVPLCIDELPILAVVACFAEGVTRVRDAGELRVKETDRIAAIVSELRKMGAAIEEFPDGFAIEGGRPLSGARVHSHGDHRMAMSLAVAALCAEGETIIEDTACVDISFPNFPILLGAVAPDATIKVS